LEGQEIITEHSTGICDSSYFIQEYWVLLKWMRFIQILL